MVGAPFYLVTEGAVAVHRGPRARRHSWPRSRSVLFELDVFLVVVAAMAFTNAALTGAILLDDVQSRLYWVRDLVRLLLWSPFDLVLYRPIITWARMKGTWGYLRATSRGTGSSGRARRDLTGAAARTIRRHALSIVATSWPGGSRKRGEHVVGVLGRLHLAHHPHDPSVRVDDEGRPLHTQIRLAVHEGDRM